jgi:putative restriction endonuclease
MVGIAGYLTHSIRPTRSFVEGEQLTEPQARLYVGVTDADWFRFLRGRPELDEVNFWQPGGGRVFQVLRPGEPFLFKLKYPINNIVGCAFFAHATRLPVSIAWDAFGQKNGTSDFADMFDRIQRLKHTNKVTIADYIGCVILRDPCFFREADWIEVPPSFSPNIVSGKAYSLLEPEGAALWDAVQLRLQAYANARRQVRESDQPMYGEPVLVRQRLGQGTFRVRIMDLYDRRCAVTGERALPVLDSAHILPISRGGQHRLDNGLLLRSDVHTLFDGGYVTVTPNYEFKVSEALKEKFDDGETYRPFQTRRIWLPDDEWLRPSRELLEWHQTEVFQG